MENRSPFLKKVKIWFNRLIGKRQWVGEWTFCHKDSNGVVLDEWKQFNALANDGEKQILDVYLRGASAPAGFYVGLVNSTPTLTTTLGTLSSEASGNGYSRQALTRDNTGWPTLALSGSYYQATSAAVVFTASGGSIGPVTYAFLATSSDSSGKLVAFVALSTTRTMANGESLTVTLSIQLQ